MGNIKVGIIGCGKHAGKNHVPVVQESSYADLVAVADIDAERAKAFADKHGVHNSYGSLKGMLDEQKLDVLIIVAFPSVHPELIKEALEHGVKTIICEKPLGLNAEQAIAIQALAAEHDALVVEGLMYRSHPQIQKVLELIDAGAIGQVRTIQCQFSDRESMDLSNWRNHRKFGGGAMTAKGCYLVDACNLFAGSPAKSAFCIESINEEFNVEIGQSGMIQYENGVTAQFETNHRSIWREEIKICGTEGTIVIPHAIVTKTQERIIEVQKGGAYEGPTMQVETIKFEVHNSYALQFENICHCISDGAKPNFPIEDSIKNYKVTDALMRSVESKKLEEVNW